MIHKCFRKMSVCFLVGLSIVMLTACGGNGNSQSSNKSSKDKGYEESAEKMELKVEDIDWRVEESILDGEKFLSLNYTNNSDYTIMDVEIKFKQKEGITKEQLSVFDEYKETYDYSDEEVAEIYILGYNRKCTRPGETAKDSPLVLNGTYYMAESMAQYELMEPETITVAFIGSNDKGYIMYYDYNSQVYGSSTHDAADIHEWSDKELAKLIDAPECVATSVDIDDDDRFCIAGHFNWDETNRALKLYGLNELYAKDARDACIIVAINNRIFDISLIDDILAEHGLKPLSQQDE